MSLVHLVVPEKKCSKQWPGCAKGGEKPAWRGSNGQIRDCLSINTNNDAPCKEKPLVGKLVKSNSGLVFSIVPHQRSTCWLANCTMVMNDGNVGGTWEKGTWEICTICENFL